MSDVPESLVDKRVVERNISKGRVDKKDYDKHLESLPDVAENAAEVEVERDKSDSDGDAGA